MEKKGWRERYRPEEGNSNQLEWQLQGGGARKKASQEELHVEQRTSLR